jgi:hypothetical protein
MASGVYNHFKIGVLAGTFNLQNGKLYVCLVKDTYTPDFDTHDFYDDIGAGEVAATNGYVQGGKVLSNPHIYNDTTNNYGVLRGSAMLWASSCITCRGAVLYSSEATDAASPLVAYFDFTTDKTSVLPGYLQIDWAAAGILAIT